MVVVVRGWRFYYSSNDDRNREGQPLSLNPHHNTPAPSSRAGKKGEVVVHGAATSERGRAEPQVKIKIFAFNIVGFLFLSLNKDNVGPKRSDLNSQSPRRTVLE